VRDGSSSFSHSGVNTECYCLFKISAFCRREYWNYLENIICYDENSEKVQKQKNLGIIYETPRKTAQELHL
jgi:hypothetical protein